MNANLPDQSHPWPSGYTNLSSTYTIGRMKNVHGESITAPWMRQWSVLPYYGCINNPDYVSMAFGFAANLIHIGSDAIQVSFL